MICAGCHEHEIAGFEGVALTVVVATFNDDEVAKTWNYLHRLSCLLSSEPSEAGQDTQASSALEAERSQACFSQPRCGGSGRATSQN